jgi:hypothetical protein
MCYICPTLLEWSFLRLRLPFKLHLSKNHLTILWSGVGCRMVSAAGWHMISKFLWILPQVQLSLLPKWIVYFIMESIFPIMFTWQPFIDRPQVRWRRARESMEEEAMEERKDVWRCCGYRWSASCGRRPGQASSSHPSPLSLSLLRGSADSWRVVVSGGACGNTHPDRHYSFTFVAAVNKACYFYRLATFFSWYKFLKC